MDLVWTAFILVAIFLSGGAWRAFRSRGPQAPAFRPVGRFLLVMAAGTLLFPALRPFLRLGIWVALFIVFICLLTVLMTALAMAKAKRITEVTHET